MEYLGYGVWIFSPGFLNIAEAFMLDWTHLAFMKLKLLYSGLEQSNCFS